MDRPTFAYARADTARAERARPAVERHGSPSEREADEVAARVTRTAGWPSAPVGANQRAPAGGAQREDERSAAAVAGAGGGQALPRSEQSFFRPRLGWDFSRVRVHTDEEAGRAAEAVRARAFTVGSHVVFGRGEYAPGTAEGRHLLAHELVHVMQQHAPGAPAQVPPPMLQKAPRAKPVAPENLALEAADATDTHEAVIKELTDYLALAVSKPQYPAVLTLRSHWREAVQLILNPKRLLRPPADSIFADLHDPDLAAQLDSLTPDARRAIAAEVERRVLDLVQSQPLAKLTKEFEQLNSNIKDNLSGAFLGWVAMREGLFRCFADIPHMNEYFAGLVPADFPSTKVKGHQTLVHPILKAKLDRARDLITRKGLMPQVEAALATGLWATEIRENTAHPSDIGTHAFGWAVDFAPGLNPDIRPFPDIFADVIGTDAGAGPEVMALRDPRITTDQALAAATALRKSSDDIVAAFANKNAVIGAISGYLSRHGAGTLDAAGQQALAALLDTAAAAKGQAAKAAATAAVTEWVLARQDRVRAAAQPSQAPGPDEPATRSSSAGREDSLWVVTMTGALGRLSHSQADLGARLAIIERQIDAPVSRAPRQAHDLGLDALYSPSSVAALKAMDATHKYYALTGLRDNLQLAMNRTMATDTAARVLEIHQLFLAAERERGKPPQDRPTAAGVAAHGWLSLPPVLIASLVSDEGAGLRWLGVMLTESHGRKLGAKDSMHFELRPSDWPRLPAGRYPDVLGHPAAPAGDFPAPGDPGAA